MNTASETSLRTERNLSNEPERKETDTCPRNEPKAISSCDVTLGIGFVKAAVKDTYRTRYICFKSLTLPPATLDIGLILYVMLKK